MARFLPFIIWFTLALYAGIDCARTPRDAMPGRMNKIAWMLVIILVPLGLGAVAWLVVKGAQRAEDGERAAGGAAARGTGGPQRRPARPRGPVAPDDDPEFLARLEQQQRARMREERRRERDAHPPVAGSHDAGGGAPETGAGRGPDDAQDPDDGREPRDTGDGVGGPGGLNGDGRVG